MAIFNSYVSLPEGSHCDATNAPNAPITKAPLGSIFGAVCGGHVADFMAHRLPRRQLAVGHRWRQKTQGYNMVQPVYNGIHQLHAPFSYLSISFHSLQLEPQLWFLCRVRSDTAFYLDNSYRASEAGANRFLKSEQYTIVDSVDLWHLVTRESSQISVKSVLESWSLLEALVGSFWN